MEPVLFDPLSDLLQTIATNTIVICLVTKKKRENRNRVLPVTPEQAQGAGCCPETAGSPRLCGGSLGPVGGQGAQQACPPAQPLPKEALVLCSLGTLWSLLSWGKQGK